MLNKNVRLFWAMKTIYLRYSGEWSNGKINGRGTIYLSTGDRYVGDWKDGKRHGVGTYFYSDGDQYDGEWRNDERVGSKYRTSLYVIVS